MQMCCYGIRLDSSRSQCHDVISYSVDDDMHDVDHNHDYMRSDKVSFICYKVTIDTNIIRAYS